MLPSVLDNTYRKYKQDTDSVAEWLASTAQSLGFATDLLSDHKKTAAASGGGRLKGKDRTKAKKQQSAAAKPQGTSSTASTGPKYLIKIADFIPLAEFVAAKSHKVPDSFRATIDRVIAARSGFGAELAESGKAIDEEKDANHRYFVGVLEQVRKVLRPFMNPGDQDATTTDELANRFAGLAVYEPSEEFLDAPDIVRPVKLESDTATYEAEAPSTLVDALFALKAVINDMNKVRHHIQSIWSTYNFGEFDVAAAAIATNTAVDLVRNMTEEVMPLLSQHGGLGSMLMDVHFCHCLYNGWKVEDLTTQVPPGSITNDDMNYQTYDLLELTYLAPYTTIACFLNTFKAGEIPIYTEGTFGTYDPRIDRSQLSGPQKHAQDIAVLMPFLAELLVAIHGVQTFTVKDEFFRTMEEAIKTQHVTFGLLFAAQIFLDVTYRLGEDIERPFLTLMTQSTVISNDIKSHFKFHLFNSPNGPPKNDQFLRQLQQNIDWFEKDPSLRVQERMYRKAGTALPQKGHRIFRMSPVISGLTLFNLRFRYREAGFAVANSSGSIQHCQHLHNALLQENLLDFLWADMYAVRLFMGDDAFFIGGKPPTDCAGYFTKYSLQMGVSAAAMTGKARKNTPMLSKSGPRGLKRSAPVLSMFADRYVHNNGRVDLTPERVDQIVEMSPFQEEESESGEVLLARINDRAKPQKKKQQMRGVPKKATEGAKMRVEELITLLSFALHAESVEFAFPYLTLHRQCWRLLHMVEKACDGPLRQIYTSAYIGRQNQPTSVVGWILMAASGQQGRVSDRRLLEMAAEPFRSFVDEGNGRFFLDNVLRDKFGMSLHFVDGRPTFSYKDMTAAQLPKN